MTRAFHITVLIAALTTQSALAANPAPELAADSTVEFVRDVAPIFEKHCLRCHKPGRPEGDLSFATRHDLFEAQHVVPGDPDSSRLLAVVTASDDRRPTMPQSGKPLTKKQVDVLRRWINGGAAWPEDIDLPRLWSLAPIRKFSSGNTANSGDSTPWLRQPIDRFVLRRLRDNGLQPAPTATRRQLIRRLKYDLLGLPPTAEEIDAFVNDSRADAWERLVDRLLGSPHYGERWGQHWLDIVRFSESNGFEDDAPRPHAWPYRDYVIRSLNVDKPYDQFVREQIAGDVLAPITRDGIIATSMLVNGPFDHAAAVSASKTEKLRAREVMLEELVTTVGQSILGLTINCARCHDHKFDPIPQADYYRIKSVFEGVYQADSSVFAARDVLTPAETKTWRRDQETLKSKNVFLHELKRKRAVIDDNENLPPLNRAVALWQYDGTGAAPGLNWEADRKGGESLIEGKWSARFGRPASPRIAAANSDQKVLDTGAGRITKNVAAGAGYAIIPSLNGSELLPSGGPMSIFARVRYTGRFDGTDDVFRIGDTGNRNLDTIGFEMVSDSDDGQHARARFVVTGQGAAREVGVTLPTPLELNRWYDLVGVFAPSEAAQSKAAGGKAAQGKEARESGVRGSITLSVADPNTGKRIGSPVTKDVDFSALSAAGRQNLLFFVAPSFENGPQPGAQMDVAAVWREALGGEKIGWLSTLQADSIPRTPLAPAMLRRIDHQIGVVEREISAVRARLARVPKALMGIRHEPQPTVVFDRGDIRSPGRQVRPAGLSAVQHPASSFGLTATSNEAERRRRFAGWVTDPRNPLPARVIVNRVWHHHFGTGIVETPSDFGVNGGRPSHPELLDWLAAQFLADGWSLKKLHRRILTSATWRQSSRFDARAAKVDSENRLLWRFTPRRLDAETVRDAMLFTSGELNRRLEGPSFRPFTTTTFNTTFYHLFDRGEPEFNRRTIYRMRINTGRDPLLDALDCPAPSVLTPRRRRTITPLQALGLMNDTFVLRQARELADSIARRETEPEQQVREAWRRTLGREPNSKDLSRAADVMGEADLQTLCWVLFNSSEFLYVR